MIERTELKIRQAVQLGDLTTGATIAIKNYGPEILGYLSTMAGTIDQAGDAFSEFCEDLWRGLPTFRWECRVQTWAYRLARHAFLRGTRNNLRTVPLSRSFVSELEEELRERTLIYLRTDVKDHFRELRSALDPSDRTLLVLRIDRRMAWSEIAEVMLDESETADRELIRKRAAALRKRFERVKEELRARAKEAGLFDQQ